MTHGAMKEVMSRTGTSRALLRAAAATLAMIGATQAGARSEKPMNIVFIEADDLTQKYVGAFGARNIKTPVIDELAKEGVMFRTAIAQGTMCAPSRNSLITGRYPRNIGLYANGTLQALPTGTWAFPKALQRQGYYTSWVGKSHIRAPKQGIAKDAPYKHNLALMKHMGFDESSSSAGRVVVMKNARKQAKGWKRGEDAYADYLYDKGLVAKFVAEKNRVSTLAPDDYLDGNIAKRAEDWIKGYKGDKPFFLWVNFSAPHGPYDAPGKWTKLYKASDAPPLIVDEDRSDIPDLMLANPWLASQDAARKQRAEYAGMVSYLDSQVGRVIDALKAAGVRDKTMIVFFSDQGVMEGDHGLEHKYTLYDEVILTSLVIDMPGGRSGAAVDQPVELLDLVQTVLDISKAPQKERQNALGYSLTPLLTGAGSYPRKAAFAELYGAVAMVTPDYKYIESAKGNVLFDRRGDPQELRNAVAAKPAAVAALAAAMKQWREKEAGPELPLSPQAIRKIMDGKGD